jgi:hypothetical protein
MALPGKERRRYTTEALCFALGMLCGILLSRLKEKPGREAPAEGGAIPPELKRQYEALFGYDGCPKPED